MKVRTIDRTAQAILLIVAVAILMLVQGCKDPKVRPGASFDGSVHWALQIAQPEITAFAADAQIYQVLAAMVWKDGRLPENTGSWSFVSWSPGLKKICQVTVSYDGGARKSIRESVDPPNSGSGGVIPAGWVNSTTAFAAIPSGEIAESFAQLVAFNFTSYPQSPNTALWAINFAGGNNPLVRWDGHYVGTQAD